MWVHRTHIRCLPPGVYASDKERKGTCRHEDCLVWMGPWFLPNFQLGTLNAGESRWHPGVRRSQDLNRTHCKAEAIRHLQREVEYGGLVSEELHSQDQERNSWDLFEDKLYPTVLSVSTQLWWVSSSKSFSPFFWQLPVAESDNVLHATLLSTHLDVKASQSLICRSL